VSTATVDRVIHNRPGVKPHTILHIQAVIREMESNQFQADRTNRQRATKQFDVLLPEGTNSFYRSLELHVESLATGAGAGDNVQFNIHRIEGFNPRPLADAIRELAPRSNGIAVVALEDPLVREAVNNAVDAGVPVVTLVSDLSNARQQAYVGLDNRAAGRTAGYLMGRFIRSPGTVLLIAGSMSLRDHEEREIGFRRTLGETQVNIVAHLEDHDDYRTNYQETLTTLDKYSDLVGIYNIGAGNRGIAQALQERGRQQEVVFIGHELTRYSRQYLLDGIMDVVIDQNPAAQARRLREVLLNLNGIQPYPMETTVQGMRLFLRENLP
jgi:LacI family transcriptional regulator